MMLYFALRASPVFDILTSEKLNRKSTKHPQYDADANRVKQDAADIRSRLRRIPNKRTVCPRYQN